LIKGLGVKDSLRNMSDSPSRAVSLCNRIDDIIERLFFHQEMLEVAIDEGAVTALVYHKTSIEEYRVEFLKLYFRMERLVGGAKPGDYTQADIDRAKEYPFEELLENNRGWARCPFHADKTPSFHIWNNEGHCFGACGKKWDTIAFIRERDGLSFEEAVWRLQG
jgi:hypothetical protein